MRFRSKNGSLDQYMLRQTCGPGGGRAHWYDEFAFHKIYHRVNHFCIVDLSAFYFDVLKDRLYISAPKSQARAQRADCDLADRRSAGAPARAHHELHLRRGLAVSAESCGPRRRACTWRCSLPTAEFWATAPCPRPTPSRHEDWTTLRSVRDEVLKALEEARNSKLIGTGLEAQVAITAADPVYSLLQRYAGQLRYLFIVRRSRSMQGSGNGTGGSAR